MMCNNNKTSEKLSFWKLIKNEKIEIPILQRDYAQGRTDEKTKSIRQKFLTALIEAINNKPLPLELDFIYGSVNNGVFQPLDGQQRLTTLFLLHWYIATKEGKLNDEVKNILAKFTYETRISSREFCSELVNKGIDFGKLLEPDSNRSNQLSKTIIDSPWFFLSWKRDPTIKGMLTTLDDIHEKLKCKDNCLWDTLINKDKIVFNFIELKNFGLSDDLYIKMNARGLLLTDFENFKACFEKYIHIPQNNWEKTVDLKNSFSYKIDTDWTNLFWKYRGDDNKIDNEMIKFIAGIAINNYAQSLEIDDHIEPKEKLESWDTIKDKNLEDDDIKKKRIKQRIKNLIDNPEEVVPEDFPDEESFKYLVDCFEKYYDYETKQIDLRPKCIICNDKYSCCVDNENNECYLPLWNYCYDKKVKINNSDPEVYNSLFYEFIKYKGTTYSQRVLFYAQTQYLLRTQEFNMTTFSDWMRVIRNIAENNSINNESFIEAIRLIKELSESEDALTNIYSYLSNSEKIDSNFSTRQLEEEKLKSNIILNSEENKKEIFVSEDFNFFKGRISFVLYCIDCKTKDDFDLQKLRNINEVIRKYLEGEINNEFRRAMFTIDNNDFYNYWTSWSSTTYSHRRCLLESTEDLKDNFPNSDKDKGKYKDILKHLLNKLIYKSLDDIIEEFSIPQDMPKWENLLIKEPEWLDNYCSRYFIGITDDNKSCFLFGDKMRPGSREDCKEVKK